MDMNFNVSIKTANFTVKVDTAACRGYFEHDRQGMDYGGGLWFEGSSQNASGDAGRKLELVDYDGVFQLPTEVFEALRNHGGFIVGDEFGPEKETT